MNAGTGTFVSMLLAGAVMGGSAQAVEISVPVDSITQEGWVRSDGGVGTNMTPTRVVLPIPQRIERPRRLLWGIVTTPAVVEVPGAT